ncbi:MAG: hypothetical protein HOE35_06915 [Candidatus Ruthia sp.]|nr:hypothetical protein [Candidatus Ruthturnera sp.]MBT4123649.1 hypothetical protein [Candidatus Ruthturnera sp.]MBT4667912.1 hypothetical protein [Candidatus Ruthturnera sp.]MBT6922696.1 hypothetical protein [Candidatus Ruthturnera sp.]
MSDYFDKFQGRFIGIMQWDDCHALLQKLINQPNDWYLYDTLSTAPTETIDTDGFINQIKEIKEILTSEHQERYCGIVYTDDLDNPGFVKIFHPKNLGKSCGSSEHPPIPQWLLSKTKPEDVVAKFGPPEEEKCFISKFLKL